jgi:hypothetical protein
MPPAVPETTPTRDLEMPESSPTSVVRLDQSGDKAIAPPADDEDITSPAGNEAPFSLDSLPIRKGSISGRVLVLY